MSRKSNQIFDEDPRFMRRQILKQPLMFLATRSDKAERNHLEVVRIYSSNMEVANIKKSSMMCAGWKVSEVYEYIPDKDVWECKDGQCKVP